MPRLYKPWGAPDGLFGNLAVLGFLFVQCLDGIYTYLGVRELLNPNTPMVLLAAIMYSVAVSVGIYAFWSFLMRLMPHVVDYGGRLLLVVISGHNVD